MIETRDLRYQQTRANDCTAIGTTHQGPWGQYVVPPPAAFLHHQIERITLSVCRSFILIRQDFPREIENSLTMEMTQDD